MRKRLGWLICLFGTWFGAQAQPEGTLYFMNSVPQVVETNPANLPRYKLAIGLPVLSSLSGFYTNNGFTYNDMVTRVNGVPQADLAKLSGNLAEKNYIQFSGSTDMFRFGLYLNEKLYLMTNASVRIYERQMIPKGLASLLVDGTAPIVNSYSNTSPEVEGTTWWEANIGLAYQASRKLTVAGRLKYINGINNITTESSSLIVEVDNNYAITATGDALVRSSGISNLNKSGFTPGFGDVFKTNGIGFGIDLGLVLKPADNFTLGLSVMDLGVVSWNNNLTQYRLDPATAKYTFSGIDLNQVVNNNNNYLKAQGDSIQMKFTMQESASASYSTMLPGRAYLSGKYAINDGLEVGALFFADKYRGRTSAGMTAAVTKYVGKWFAGTVSYTASNRSYNNIGLGLSFNFTPVQFYIVGDNLLRAPVSLITDQNINSYVNSSQLISIRTGINIVLGWDQAGVRKEKVSDDSHNPKEKQQKAKVKNTYGRSPRKKR